MTKAELESRLEAGIETQSFDVKASMPWDANKLAKDILAMSNVRDGGFILIGVEDNFTRTGVSEEVAKTYKIDVMRDKMAKYADPHVDFSVSFPMDKGGLTYVAIRIEPFREIPVICRSEGADVHAGVVYYRNTDRRVESAAISNSYDMRDVILMAVARTREQYRELGIRLGGKDTSSSKFDAELGGL